jgi:transposase-like protein
VTFENIKTGFVVTFYRPEPKIIPEKVKKSEGVSEGVKLLVESIRKNPGQRVPSISQATNIAPKTLERWLRKLKKEGKINFKGSAKTGGYYVQ